MSYTSLGLSGPVMFLGAYVKHVSSSLGMSTNPSSVTVTLVEDELHNAYFQYPTVGTYYTLQVGSNWSFSGIITKYEIDVKNIGGRTIRVTMSDPREVMQHAPIIMAPGSQVIASTIANTNCSVLDVFGAFNIAGGYFNLSGWNEAGMTYERIAGALEGEQILYGATTIWVNPQLLTAYGEQYRFDLSEVTAIVDTGYRINANLTTLSNLIEDLASKNSFDWYVTSSRASDNVIDVVIKVIDRSADSTTLRLQEFMDAHPYRVISATSGIELRNELSCIVLQGAPVEQMQKVEIVGLANEPIDLIRESGSTTYVMTEDEMRAVLAGKSQWEMWVSIPTTYGGGGGLSRYGGNIQDSWLQSPVSNEVVNLLNEIRFANLIKNQRRTKAYLESTDETLGEAVGNAELVGRIYEKLRAHADASYGKRFVHNDVHDEIIESCWTRDVVSGDDDPYEHFRQQDGRTRAFVEFVVDNADDVLELGLTTLTTSYGNQPVFRNVTKFGDTFARHISGNLITRGIVLVLENATIDLSNAVIGMDKSAYTFNSTGSTLYCACTIDKDGVVRIEAPILEARPNTKEILNRIVAAAASSASAPGSLNRRITSLQERLVEINATIFQLRELYALTTNNNERESIERQIESYEAQKENVEALLAEAQQNSADITTARGATDADGNTQDDVNLLLGGVKHIFGPGTFDMHARAYQPKYLHVPTRARYTRYGPVFPSNLSPSTEGKLEIINDDGFAPWEFGSVSLMNAAMQLKVDNAISPQREVFSGQIVVEGFPQYSLGQALEKNANINNISISFGDGGVTTTYQLQTFTRKFGQFTKEDWARLALFANNGALRVLPQRIINFIENHRIHVNRQFTGRGASLGGSTTGGALSYE